jgi:hypothetical protein
VRVFCMVADVDKLAADLVTLGTQRKVWSTEHAAGTGHRDDRFIGDENERMKGLLDIACSGFVLGVINVTFNQLGGRKAIFESTRAKSRFHTRSDKCNFKFKFKFWLCNRRSLLRVSSICKNIVELFRILMCSVCKHQLKL